MKMRALVAAAAIAGLAGCTTVSDYFGGEDNSLPPAPLPPIEATIQLQTVWRADVGASTSNRYIKLTPVVDGDAVYAADPEGTVAAYAADTGDRLWTVDADFELTGGPGSGDGLVLVGGSDGQVLALEGADGAVRWRARVSSEVLAAPQAAHGVVVVRSEDGKLFGLSAKSGKRLWVYDRSVPTLTLRGTSAPAIAGDTVVAGFDSGRLVAISLLDGRSLWETRLTVPTGRSELERLVDIDSQPVVADDTVYSVTYQGRVAAIDIFTGDVLWQRDMSSHTGVAVDAGDLYLSDDKGHIWALERRSSASIWKQSKLERRGLTKAVPFGDYVVVGDQEGWVHWLNREDGQFVARIQIDDEAIIAPPVVANGKVYVYSTGGELAALSVAGEQ